MGDLPELEGLNPFDLLDDEVERLVAFFAALPPEAWERPSRCDGWSVRDVLAHLLSGEEYHQACLAGTVSATLARWGELGATDLDTANEVILRALDGVPPADLLARWQASNADTRARFRERGDGTVDTSIGEYSCRLQAFHVAGEIATHADDVYVTVAPAERGRRSAWRARASRFYLAEARPDAKIDALDGGRTHVAHNGVDVTLDDDEMVEAVMGRLDDAKLDAKARALLQLF